MTKSILTFLGALTIVYASAQNTESEIRTLEGEAREAILRKDTIALKRLFSPDFVVNSPANRIETFQDLLGRIKHGGIDRETFEKNIEKVTITQNVAIVMGNEIVKPTGSAVDSGKTVKRRYTNVWIKNEAKWQLVARQSTITLIE